MMADRAFLFTDGNNRYHALRGIGVDGRGRMVEKAVDVMLAVDMVVGAERGEFDAAHLLSADGDFTPAVEAVRAHGKKVYIASPASGAQLAKVASAFIRMDRAWFDDCYQES